MNSFNHYAFGSVGEYLYSVVGGIKPLSTAFKTILVQPVAGAGLTWANTSYNSRAGLIATAWTNVGGTLNLDVVIPPNTSAQVYVPTTNANAITESGVPATNSPGVTWLANSNGCAIYAVGSGRYSWSSPVPIQPPPLEVTETDAVFSGGSFPPLQPGELLTNSTTTIISNTIVVGPENHITVTALKDGNIGAPGTTNRSYEISSGSVTFRLGAGPYGDGYTVTNLSTYTAWQDDGRENPNYAVSYSMDGSNFFPVGSVAYNPSHYPTIDGTGGTLTSLVAANLSGVQYLMWTFSAAQQNGGVGYTEVAAFGQPSVPVPVSLGVGAVTSTTFTLNASGLVPGQSYILQSATNLSSGTWSTETNFISPQPSLALTISRVQIPEKFYRLIKN